VEAQPEAVGRNPVGPAALLRPRLSLPPSREPGLPLRAAAARLRLDVDPLRGSSRDQRRDQRLLLARAGLVPQLLLLRGASPGARRRRGPCLSRSLPLRSRRGRGGGPSLLAGARR